MRGVIGLVVVLVAVCLVCKIGAAPLQIARTQRVEYNPTQPTFDMYVPFNGSEADSFNKTMLRVATITIPVFEEIHYPSNPTNSYAYSEESSPNQRVAAVFNPLNQTWASKVETTSNSVTVTLSSTMPNGASIVLNATIHNTSSTPYPIPRYANDLNCTLSHLYSTCSCDEFHETPKNALKFTLAITNYTFQPFNFPPNTTTSDPVRLLSTKFTFSGPVDVLYYYRTGFSDLMTNTQCDVTDLNVVLINNISIPISFFQNCVADDETQNIGIVLPDRQQLSPLGSDLQLPIQIFFPQFNSSLVYDPDFSVLFAGMGDEDEGTGTGGTGGDGGSGTGAGRIEGGTGGGGVNKKLVAGLVVGIGGAVICLIVIGIVIAVVVKFATRSIDLTRKIDEENN
eukprot:TRINITY_DN598_c3_g1_i1.p1 TRINITY_DN598_c3_g1~~TRINITY_DN598_c3_g1_i1.p1  ORF type:complete len:410 (-),score=142.60 TRINITY_DN598_c3_g1_i1:126-1316(-)